LGAGTAAAVFAASSALAMTSFEMSKFWFRVSATWLVRMMSIPFSRASVPSSSSRP